jgi:hypothetical protein
MKARREPLDELCTAFRGRLRAATIRAGVMRLMVVSVLLLAVAITLDFLFHFPSYARLLVLLAFIGALGAMAYVTIVRPLRRVWSDSNILAWLDRLAGRESMLLDLHELAASENFDAEKDPAHAALIGAAVEQLLAAQAATPVALDRAFDRRRMRRLILAISGVAIFAAAGGIGAGTYAAIGLTRFINPFSSARWPHRTTLAVEVPPAGWNVPQGESLPLRVKVSGMEIPRVITVSYRTEKSGWLQESIPVPADRLAQYIFAEIRGPISFYVNGGDDTTDTYQVTITRRPALEHITASVNSPVYSGVPSRVIEGGEIYGLEGSRVTIEFTSSAPLAKAGFVLGDGPEEFLPVSQELKFSKTMLLEKSTRYSVHLYGVAGYRESRPELYDLRVTPDNPPEAAILAPDAEVEGTNRVSVKVHFKASDDFGLKAVQFFYQEEGAQPQQLTDHITGPIVLAGKSCECSFSWDFSKMNLPAKDMLTLEYFVRAADENPTGRGITETPHQRIRIVKSSIFRENLLESAKALLNEALLAEKNSRMAYFAGKQFLSGKGSGAENDPLWQEIMERQTGAVDAAQAMSHHLESLLDRAGANRLEPEFMAGRLTQAGQFLRPVLDLHHPAIDKKLKEVKPKTSAEAAPAAQLARRKQALASVSDTATSQKMATLLLQRILTLLFDWTDLQTAAVSTLRLHEQHSDVCSDTEKIAPVFIGKNILSLADEDQLKLATIGQHERAIFESESALEEHLKEILRKAEKMARKNIFAPINAAFKELRARQVREFLRKSADAIDNNQPADCVNDQKTALAAFLLVRAGLEKAGAQLDTLPEPALAQAVSELDPESVLKPAETISIATIPNGLEDEPVLPPLGNLGSDPLTAGLQQTADQTRDICRRAEHLELCGNEKNMPRFMELRLGRLSERHETAQKTLEDALHEAEKAKDSLASTTIEHARPDFSAVGRLLREKTIAAGIRQILTDTAATLTELTQAIGDNRFFDDTKLEHDRQGGIDPFKQPYIFRGADLSAVTEAAHALISVQVALSDATRKQARFQKISPASGASLIEIESSNKKREETRAGQIQALFAKARQSAAACTPETKTIVDQTLAPLGESVTAADPVRAAILGIRKLIDDRSKRQEVAAEVPTDVPPPDVAARMTEEEYRKLTSIPALRKRIENATELPVEVRNALTKSLAQDFPPEHERLLSGFLDTILTAAEGEKK